MRHNTGHQQKAATHWLPAWYSTGHSLCSGQSARVPERQSVRVRVQVRGNLDATWTESLRMEQWRCFNWMSLNWGSFLFFVFHLVLVKFNYRPGGVSAWPPYLLLVQLEGGLDEIPQGGQLLLLLVLSLLDLSRTSRFINIKIHNNKSAN